MFITTHSIQAETAYRQERTKRDYRATTRKQSQPERAPKPEPRRARRSLRPTHAA
jgi:hypothetical protein